MRLKLLLNNFRRGKLPMLTTAACIAGAAMLLSLVLMLTSSVLAAIDGMLSAAKTPHYLQMHSGELDMDALLDFAESTEGVKDFQVLRMLNIDGASIRLGQRDLADSMQDNGFCVQSDRFDYLLSLKDEVLDPQPGELWVPLMYMKEGWVKAGDAATVAGRPFKVAGFLRDSQMNSPLASSKRFLIHEADYAALAKEGSEEYLIEFWLDDLSRISALEKAYQDAALPANGPTVTYPLFRLMNAITDGVLIAVLFLMSLLLALIALLCVRFTLLARLADERREIGVLKAVGLRYAQVRGLYLFEYAVLAGVGAALGWMVSLLVKEPLLKDVRLFMGEARSPLTPWLGLLGAILSALMVVLFVMRVLRRLRRLSPAEALRPGGGTQKRASLRGFKLSRSSALPLQLRLTLRDVLGRKRLYLTMLLVFTLSAFLLVVPQNMYRTLSSRRFVEQLGIGNADLLLHTQGNENFEERQRLMVNLLSKDPDIVAMAQAVTKTFTARREGQSDVNIKVSLGDQRLFSPHYVEGQAPADDSQIALSTLLAEDMGMSAGDKLTLMLGDTELPLTVSGLYADVTNGGKTAKAMFEAPGAPAVWGAASVRLKDPSMAEQKAAEFAEALPFAKVSHVAQVRESVLGGTLRALSRAAAASAAAGLLVIFLLTALFMRMLMHVDRYPFAVMRALGFVSGDIRSQLRARGLVVLGAGMVLGILLAAVLGGPLSGALVSSFGGGSLVVQMHPLFTFAVAPLLMAATLMLAVRLSTLRVADMTLYNDIKE